MGVLLVRERRGPIQNFYMGPPKLKEPYVPNDWPNKFYEMDSEQSSCIAGYKNGPKNSYTRELAKIYPLQGK